jgi:hypothetical protein
MKNADWIVGVFVCWLATPGQHSMTYLQVPPAFHNDGVLAGFQLAPT